jgi:fatty acid desaturase
MRASIGSADELRSAGRVSWVAIFSVFLVCHLVGDFLFQTDWQAEHKYGGLGGDPIRRRALVTHVLTYGVAFLPALVWIGGETAPWRAVLAAVIVLVPHLVQDDGRLLDAYMLRVKGPGSLRSPGLRVACDQSFHVACLLGAALLVVA